MDVTSGASTADPAAVVADIERRARRFETPCGNGALTWRAWGSGPPVLLAHGANGSWVHWIRNIAPLAAERTVWAIDLPGWGDSAMPPRADHEAIADVIAEGLRRLLAPALPLDIVGFSFGGVAGAHLAAFYPALVRRLILVDTGGLDTPMGAVSLHRMRGLEGEARKAASRANLLGLMLHDPASADELAVHIQMRFASRGGLDAAALVLPDKLIQVLPRVPAQLDAIWGEHDRPHPDPSAQERVLRRFQPDMEFRIIPGAGHWVMYERPAAFNSAVLDLLSRPLRANAAAPT